MLGKRSNESYRNILTIACACDKATIRHLVKNKHAYFERTHATLFMLRQTPCDPTVHAMRIQSRELVSTIMTSARRFKCIFAAIPLFMCPYPQTNISLSCSPEPCNALLIIIIFIVNKWHYRGGPSNLQCTIRYFL